MLSDNHEQLYTVISCIGLVVIVILGYYLRKWYKKAALPAGEVKNNPDHIDSSTPSKNTRPNPGVFTPHNNRRRTNGRRYHFFNGHKIWNSR